MSQIWKTIPLFISSTFRDMHAERDQLNRVVLESAGHATIAAPLRQQLQAKLPRKKKGWKFW